MRNAAPNASQLPLMAVRDDLTFALSAIQGSLGAIQSLFLYCDKDRADIDPIDVSELIGMVKDRVSRLEASVSQALAPIISAE